MLILGINAIFLFDSKHPESEKSAIGSNLSRLSEGMVLSRKKALVPLRAASKKLKLIKRKTALTGAVVLSCLAPLLPLPAPIEDA